MPEIVLRQADHAYLLEGRRVPGATEILDGLGLIDTRWFTEESRIRGQAIHMAVHYYLEGTLEWGSVDERIKGWVDAALLLISDSACETRLVEHRVYHPGPPEFCGTLDWAGLWLRKDALIDWKSGLLLPATGLQTALYDLGLGGPRRRRMAVQLKPTGKYVKHDLDDRKDYPRALAAADLYTRYLFDEKGRKVYGNDDSDRAARSDAA